jgi:LAO/AO transport system kinase
VGVDVCQLFFHSNTSQKGGERELSPKGLVTCVEIVSFSTRKTNRSFYPYVDKRTRGKREIPIRIDQILTREKKEKRREGKIFFFLSGLSDRVLKGERNAISRAISVIENKEPGYSSLIGELYPHTGSAYIVGITGPLGTGKSSLVDRLLRSYREAGKKVAVLAVDPSSPISGGAILGDRVRMVEHSLDAGVYIRSMASRGDEGGLSKSTLNATRVLDAAGFDLVFVETVGIGQTEAEVVKIADTVVVVLMPELGDEVQAVKAGLMEIGDIFAVNKSDLPGADRVIYNLRSVLSTKSDGWSQISVGVSAKTSKGIDELVKAIEDHRNFLARSDLIQKRSRQRLSEELLEIVTDSLVSDVKERLTRDEEFRRLVGMLLGRQIDPRAAADVLLGRYRVIGGSHDGGDDDVVVGGDANFLGGGGAPHS